MRTTIELDDELRAELLKLAARRGEKGYSSLVNEALREFVEKEKNRQEGLEEVLDLRGSLSDEEANQWEKRIDRAWEHWEL